MTRQYRGLYSGYGRPRLWRVLAAAGVTTLSLGVGACSMSSQLDSLFGSDQTGSVKPPPGSKAETQLPPDADLAYARAAATAVLGRGEKDSSQPWENPATGTRGTVTPVASAYTQDGQTCRNFLASFVSGSSQAWVQGEACKQQQGVWEVRTLKPWKQS